MTRDELITLLESEGAFYASLDDLEQVILYGSALDEEELKNDVDLMLVPSRPLSPAEETDLRQNVWSKLKDHLPVMLEVKAANDDLDPAGLDERGVPMKPIWSREA